RLEELDHFAIGPLAERDADGGGRWVAGDVEAFGLHGDDGAVVAGAVQGGVAVGGAEGEVQDARVGVGPGLLRALEEFEEIAVADVEHRGARWRGAPGDAGRESQALDVETHRAVPVADTNRHVMESAAADGAVGADGHGCAPAVSWGLRE